MGIGRIARHLIEHRWRVRRVFPSKVLANIEAAIRTGETTHAGQVRFVVEGALDGAPLLHNQPARARALDIFSHLRIWDTAHNNGVLIYLLLAEHAIEIVADRGIDAHVDDAEWAAMAQRMSAAFREGRFEDGLTQALEEISALLVEHFPLAEGEVDVNELPDEPVVL